MTIELINRKSEAARKQLDAAMTELKGLEERATHLGQASHNLKVQIATYDDLLADDTAEVSDAVRETVETLVAGE